MIGGVATGRPSDIRPLFGNDGAAAGGATVIEIMNTDQNARLFLARTYDPGPVTTDATARPILPHNRYRFRLPERPGSAYVWSDRATCNFLLEEDPA